MRSAKELEAKHAAALRERKAAVATAISSKTAELTAAADRARAALTANLEVMLRGGGKGAGGKAKGGNRRTLPIWLTKWRGRSFFMRQLALNAS